MTRFKRFFVFLCTLPLLNILLTLWLYWDERHANPDSMSGGGFLLLCGGFFVLGLIAGLLFGAWAKPRWQAFFLYSLLSLFVLPQTYIELWRGTDLFWQMFLFYNCQQTLGFAAGMWYQMRRAQERETQHASQKEDF